MVHRTQWLRAVVARAEVTEPMIQNVVSVDSDATI